MSTTAPPTRDFTDFLRQHEGGRFANHVTGEFRDFLGKLSQAAGLRGGKAAGKFTLTIDVSLDGGIAEITGDAKHAVPKLKRGKGVFWLTPENNLSATNPDQPELPLRDVTAGAAVARNLA